VTWVEHVEVDDRSVHSIYKLLVNAGLAFGARRWVGTLDRQCERLASVMASNIPTSDIGGKALYHASQHTICSLCPIESLKKVHTLMKQIICCSDH